MGILMSSRDELANELYRTGEQLDTCKEQRIKLVMQVVQLEDLCDAKDQEIKLCHQHIAELKAQAEEDERLGAQLEEVADERDKAEACLADFKHGMTQDHADLVNARHRIAELEALLRDIRPACPTRVQDDIDDALGDFS
jgi:chromosome segregation ATPase